MGNNLNLTNVLASAVIGGICIGLAGLSFLAVGGGNLGAAVFSIGLFVICINGFHLYTGKVCYVFDNKPAYLAEVAMTYIGNLIGTMIVGIVIRFTRISNVTNGALEVLQPKLMDTYASLFLLGVLCNIFIFIAVDGFKTAPSQLSKHVCVFLGVFCFVLCTSEHSIADMFYVSCASAWSAETVLRILVISAGNALGGILIERLSAYAKGKIEFVTVKKQRQEDTKEAAGEDEEQAEAVKTNE